jgi:hypothetical protein
MEGRPTIQISVHDEIDGAEVSPDAVPIDLLKEFAGEVEAFLGGSDAKDAGPLIVSVQKGSLALRQESPASDRLHWDIGVLESSKDVSGVDPKRAGIVLKWQRRADAQPNRRYSISDVERGHSFVVSRSTTYFRKAADLWVSVQRKVLGEVVDMGGTKKPNVHLRLADGTMLLIGADHDRLASERENRLYQRCLLRITAEENVDTGEIRSARLIAFEDYAPQIRQGILDTMRANGSEAWAGIDAVAWTRDRRGD